MQILFFLLVYFGAYGGAHYFFFQKVKAFGFSPAMDALAAVFLSLMLAAPFLVVALQRLRAEGAARMLALTGYSWMAFLFLFLCLDLILQPLRWLPGLPFWAGVGPTRLIFTLAALAALLAVLAGYRSARTPRLERVFLTSGKWPREKPPLRIVQISDLHIGLIVQKQRLQQLLARVNGLQPDVIVSTGDLVDAPIRRSQECADLLRQLRAPLGKFAVLGNHEIYAGLEQAVAFTQAAGFRLLRQETVTADGFAVSGVDDPVLGNGAQVCTGSADPALFSILLKHRPVLESGSGRVDLQLSGHVHHGQIFPFSLLAKLFNPFFAGLYRLDQLTLYVSRGTGTWGPPVRFLAPPEITLFEVASARENRPLSTKTGAH